VIKMLYAWHDRPDLGREGSEEHYRNVHMPLAREAFDGVPGFRALVYSRVEEQWVNDYNDPERSPVEPEFDAFVELYFDDEESLLEATKGPGFTRLFADHENFMAVDIPRNNRVFRLSETTLLRTDSVAT
jgi:uncharacterized protein (TIGR02118 family)